MLAEELGHDFMPSRSVYMEHTTYFVITIRLVYNNRIDNGTV